MKTLDVAIGIIFSGQQLLICRRHANNPALPGMWEFPGGKLEPGESAEDCLHRELDEELEISVRIIAPLPPLEHAYPAARVRLLPFICEHAAGEPKPIGCEEARWIDVAEIGQYPFPPANDEIIGNVRRWQAAAANH